MIRRITIENFKSIQKLELDLGRVNVLIGENGCGKTNILEAIAFAGAAARDPISTHDLAPLGIRVTEPRLVQSALAGVPPDQPIHIRVEGDDGVGFELDLSMGNDPTAPGWTAESVPTDEKVAEERKTIQQELVHITSSAGLRDPRYKRLLREAADVHRKQWGAVRSFLIYAPENSTLRTSQAEAHVPSLGVRGEGLYMYLKTLRERDGGAPFAEIVERLSILDWFDGLEIPKDLAALESRIDIRDYYLAEGVRFDQHSANEGFLFLLFYFILFISPDTPAFFAIDNIDTSLNPKLCMELMRQLVDLAKKHDKQVVLTTHNPSTLDGLRLPDDEQRLFSVSRDIDGYTKACRIMPPKPMKGVDPVPLSEAFVHGYIGGLPNNF